jgi:hypothetical protein
LLAPIAGPIATGSAEAIEAGKDVEGVSSAHITKLSLLMR